jgi:hypothetical protein
MIVVQRTVSVGVFAILGVMLSCPMARVVGAQDDSSSARREYDALLRAYQNGERDSSVVLPLFRGARMLHEDSVARTVGLDYVNHSLGARPLRERLAKTNVQLAVQLMQSTSDSAFSLFYHQSRAVDSVWGHPDFAETMASFRIGKEEIDPKVWRNGKALVERPDWEAMRPAIVAKYGARMGDRVILDAEIEWGKRTSGSPSCDWSTFAHALAARYERFPLDTANPGGVNNMIYRIIFLHSDDRVVLAKAIHWMEMVVRLQPRDVNDLDTYANLLYKVGRTPEAITWEEKAAALAGDDAEIQAALAKMRRGEPTWQEDGASSG